MTSGLEPTVREVRSGEVLDVVAIHREAFPRYQSSQLGPAFCRRLLLAYAAHPSAALLVAIAPGGGVVGYLVGSPPSIQRRVNDRLIGWAMLASAGVAIRAPSAALAKVPAAARRGRRAVGAVVARATASGRVQAHEHVTEVEPEPRREADVRVVLVAVAKTARGAGYGDALLGEFARWAAKTGHRWADLSVIAENQAACGAYERNGWEAGGLEGRGSTQRYWLRLGGTATSDS